MYILQEKYYHKSITCTCCTSDRQRWKNEYKIKEYFPKFLVGSAQVAKVAVKEFWIQALATSALRCLRNGTNSKVLLFSG